MAGYSPLFTMLYYYYSIETKTVMIYMSRLLCTEPIPRPAYFGGKSSRFDPAQPYGHPFLLYRRIYLLEIILNIKIMNFDMSHWGYSHMVMCVFILRHDHIRLDSLASAIALYTARQLQLPDVTSARAT